MGWAHSRGVGNRRPGLALAALIVLAGAACCWASVQKGASVSLRARWQGTPYLLEAAEFLADEDPQLYWRLLDDLELGDAAVANSSSGGAECWHSIVEQSSKLCLPQVAKLLPVVLGVRQYSARLEMFRQVTKQLYPDAAKANCCFADVGGSIVTDAADVPGAVSAAGGGDGPVLQEADHVLNPERRDAPGAVVAILHGAPGTGCWAALHAALKAAVGQAPEDAPVVYAHRPVLPAACEAVHPCASLGAEEQLVLPGFGVEAVLKNTEYSAMDDKAKQDDSSIKAKQDGGGGGAGQKKAAAADALGDLGEVKGFRFDVLARRKPALVQELATFRDALLSSDEEEAIKVWDVKDAGLQAASRVAASSDPLALLEEISQNFPALVSSLTRQKVPDRLRSVARANQRILSPGANFLLLNGMLLEVNNFELFSFLERVRIELRLQGQLQGMGLQPGLVRQLLETRSEANPDAMGGLRLDLSSMKQVLWLNNPARDKAYSHLSRDLGAALNMFPGRLAPMAASLMHVVVVADPSSREAVDLAAILQRVWSRQLPVRVGLLPVVADAVTRAEAQRAAPGRPVDAPTWEDMSTSERFTRALLTLRSAFGMGGAWRFWSGAQGSLLEAALERGDAKAAARALKDHFTFYWDQLAQNPRTSKARVAAKKSGSAAWSELLEGSGYSSECGMQLADASSFLLSKGLAHLPKPSYWLNGLLSPVAQGGGQAAVDQELGYAMMAEMQVIQEHIYFGRIDEEQPVIESLMELQTSVRRWNPRVLGVDEDAGGSAPRTLSLASAAGHPGAKELSYLHPAGTSGRVKPATHWVVADLASPRGRGLARAALRFLMDPEEELDPEGSRVALLLAPAGGRPGALDVAVSAAQKAFRGDPKLPALLEALVGGDHGALGELPAGGAGGGGRLGGKQRSALREAAEAAGVAGGADWDLGEEEVEAALASLASVSRLVTGELGLPAGSAAVVTNGRLVWDSNPAWDTQPPALVAEDFELLQLHGEVFASGELLAKVLKAARSAAKGKGKEGAEEQQGGGAAALGPEEASDIVMVTASVLQAQVYPDSRFGSLVAKQIVEVLGSLRGSALAVGPPPSQAELALTAIVNPLTREAQRMSQVLSMLQGVLSPSLSLHLNPHMDLSELPLKSFYRYALPEFRRDESGRIAMPGVPSAYFNRLPTRRVLTLNLEVPESWLVEPVMALHDLDNLRLADVPEQVAYAEYELEAVMLTGGCSEVAPAGAGRGAKLPPPRGLQLHLGTAAAPHMVDTLVMQNLGYFQLKASPGLWRLSIAPGRSRELYKLVGSGDGSAADLQLGRRPSAGGGGGGSGGGGGTGGDTDYSVPVLLQSFTGKHLLLRVQKRPGKERAPLLPADADDPAGRATGLSQLKGGNDDVINVFTVASGHMYERLQKIMILSVIKNTKSRVKFWIIKNYMSPHHKRIIPAMAERYGFDYEFVTYRWPHWLHRQTDKQRIIWAYKILFLDVLFPLDVPRMIFVDSDQVVRTDLAELYRMDLKGAPMAYTPFCDNNKEMDPYRFWKTGFWEGHLQGKPYHISALYLIDLVRFRQMSAGDSYRVMYDNLSKDPHSLANLDQDLPNYAQHSIPIFSLPQEWLWCESWCGDQTKAKARTIDLCNNPKTKEPKLQSARRIVAEWPALDEEQAEFTAEVDAKFREQEEAFAADGGEQEEQQQQQQQRRPPADEQDEQEEEEEACGGGTCAAARAEEEEEEEGGSGETDRSEL